MRICCFNDEEVWHAYVLFVKEGPVVQIIKILLTIREMQLSPAQV